MTRGAVDEHYVPPWWYEYIHLARWLHVPPWELAGCTGPVHWLWAVWARIVRDVDAETGQSRSELDAFFAGS